MSRCPPEVWDRIFDVATYVPYTLVPEIFEKASFIGAPYNDEYHPALRATRATKYNLVCVCKHWWYLATPYLYRTIYIDSPRSLLSLSNTLRSYAEGGGVMAHASRLGLWAQRLDVSIELAGHPNNLTYYPDDLADHLAEIIKYLPNLTIISIAFPSSLIYGPMPPTVPHSLRGCASLRVLDCEGSFSLPLQDLEELLMNSPHLRILNCHHLRWANGLLPSSTLSSLSTLGLREAVPGIDHTGETCSQETHVRVNEVIVHVTGRHLDQWSDFVQRYSRCLTSIQLRYDGNPELELDGYLDIYLDMIKQSCPSIRRLTIFLPSFEWLRVDIDGSSFPAIEYLGLRAAERHLPSYGHRRFIILFHRIATLKTQIPTLSVVQLVDHVNVEQVCEYYSDPSVRPHVDRVLNGMLRVQDHEGNPLSERLAATASTW
ncbi:hypothetical protein EDC04DRAFT_2909085 [Pisolithus marmoratus]|nr:hypothetical protein EDC04DRAFT_2909085 [Pisolithus marmoratus]